MKREKLQNKDMKGETVLGQEKFLTVDILKSFPHFAYLIKEAQGKYREGCVDQVVASTEPVIIHRLQKKCQLN